MADAGPNFKIEKKRLELEKNSLYLAIQRQELRFLEIEEERTKIETAILGLQKNITDLEEKISKMPA